MKKKIFSVDEYFSEGCGRCELGSTPQCKVNTWAGELKLLRKIALECELSEELKWSMPCYTFQNSNVIIVSAFKEYCSVNFFKGSLLKDAKNLLVKPGENTQAARLMKFTSTKDINKLKTVLKAYILEAIEIERSGIKVDLKDNTDQVFPEEFQQQLDENPALKSAFFALTPGRQRAYNLHFSQPKQSKTRASRVEKCIPKILDGIGFHDR